jgi:hypothetical protein
VSDKPSTQTTVINDIHEALRREGMTLRSPIYVPRRDYAGPTRGLYRWGVLP